MIQFFMLLAITVLSFSCVKKSGELGSAENPIKIHFLPSVDAKAITESTDELKKYLELKTPYKYEIMIPQSYIAVVEAFGTKKADVAAMNTFGYILAREKYGVEAAMTVLRHDSSTYQSQFITRTDSPIQKVEDLSGKKVAFVDPASASGFLLPMKTLKDKKVSLKETVFAMKHDSVVTMIYQGQVDAGATFYSPPVKDKEGVSHIEDARRLVLTQFPDVEKKIKIIDLSEAIPNDPIVFRKELTAEMKAKIVTGFADFVASDEGKAAFMKMYGVTGIKRASDQDYDGVRKMLLSLGKSASDLMVTK